MNEVTDVQPEIKETPVEAVLSEEEKAAKTEAFVVEFKALLEKHGQEVFAVPFLTQDGRIEAVAKVRCKV